MDMNIEMAENGIVVKCHDKTGEGENTKYIDNTYVFPDIEEFQDWLGANHKGKKFNKDKGKIEQILGSGDDE